MPRATRSYAARAMPDEKNDAAAAAAAASDVQHV